MSDVSILIISDEEATRESLQYILNEEGYSCFTSPDFKKALRLLQMKSADIVLFDCQKLGSNSINVIGKLKKVNPEIIIVILTSYSDADFAFQALRMGAECFLFKPVDFDELLNVLKFSALKNTFPKNDN